jgi:hypothetical protein
LEAFLWDFGTHIPSPGGMDWLRFPAFFIVGFAGVILRNAGVSGA